MLELETRKLLAYNAWVIVECCYAGFEDGEKICNQFQEEKDDGR